MNLEFKNFAPEDALEVVPRKGSKDEQDLLLETAKLNTVSGPGYTAFIDGKAVGCGGIRIYGIGEAWAMFSPVVLEHRLTFLHETKKRFIDMSRENHLWKIWCELETEETRSILHKNGMTENERIEARRLQQNYVRFLGFREIADSFVRR